MSSLRIAVAGLGYWGPNLARNFAGAVDATLVRCLVVPASLVLAGRAAWWLPAGVDRALPRLGVEDVDGPEPVGSARGV